MHNDEARFVLSACQPSGAEADRPEIAEALTQARRDPALGGWLERERQSDLALARKLNELEAPSDLRTRLLAGGRASRRAHSRRAWRNKLALAASLVLAAASGWWVHSLTSPAPESSAAAGQAHLSAWRRECVAVFASPFFRLDVERNTYEPLASYLAAQHAPSSAELPFSTAIVSAVGCKVLSVSGATVSLTCFRADTGELVHLFVGAGAALDQATLSAGPIRAQAGAFATVTWLSGDRIVMVASKLPAAQLERMLDHARLAIRSTVAELDPSA